MLLIAAIHADLRRAIIPGLKRRCGFWSWRVADGWRENDAQSGPMCRRRRHLTQNWLRRLTQNIISPTHDDALGNTDSGPNKRYRHCIYLSENAWPARSAQNTRNCIENAAQLALRCGLIASLHLAQHAEWRDAAALCFYLQRAAMR